MVGVLTLEASHSCTGTHTATNAGSDRNNNAEEDYSHNNACNSSGREANIQLTTCRGRYESLKYNIQIEKKTTSGIVILSSRSAQTFYVSSNRYCVSMQITERQVEELHIVRNAGGTGSSSQPNQNQQPPVL